VISSDSIPVSSHGIAHPTGWKNRGAIAVSHRTDNNTIITIPGNDIAIEPSRSGNTNPVPDGAMFGKVVWKDAQLNNWKAAAAPSTFVHAECMFKDSKKYPDTYNWGWARWVA
jgi:hypothetical protein